MPRHRKSEYRCSTEAVRQTIKSSGTDVLLSQARYRVTTRQCADVLLSQARYRVTTRQCADVMLSQWLS